MGAIFERKKAGIAKFTTMLSCTVGAIRLRRLPDSVPSVPPVKHGRKVKSADVSNIFGRK